MGKRDVPSVRSYYDAVAHAYESNRSAAWYKEHGLLLLDLVADGKPVRRVLDIGCGTGFLLRQLARRNADLEGVGVDLSGGMVQEARRLAEADELTNLRFRELNWEDPGPAADPHIAAGQFDLVICASCLHYLSDPRTALRRMQEMLRPGVRLLLLDRAADGSPATAFWGLIHRFILRDTVRFYTTQQLAGHVEAAGFTRVEHAARLRRVFWKGKLKTSLAVIAAETSLATTSKGHPS